MLKVFSKLEILSKHEIYKYLTAVILLVVPLYPKFPFIDVPDTFVSIRVEDFIIAIASIFLAIKVYENKKSFFYSKLNKSIFLFIGVGLVSLISAIFITKTVTIHIGVLHWMRRIEYFIPFYLGFYALKDKNDLNFYLKTIMVVVIIMFIYGLGQRYSDWPIIATQNEEYSKGVALRYREGGHISSTFAGHYDLSTFLVLTLPVFVGLIFRKVKQVIIWQNIILITVVLGGLWLVAVSGSRISSVSFLISSTLALLISRKYKVIPLVVIVSMLIFSISPSLRARYLRLYKVTKDKIQTLVSYEISTLVYAAEGESGLPQRRKLPDPTPTPVPRFEDRSTSIRLNVEWPRAIRSFKKNPLLGTGYSSISLATDNDYLRMLGEVGIVGFLAFFLIITQIFSKILKQFPFTKYGGIELVFITGIIGGFVGVLVNGVFIDIFEASKFATIFWLLMGMMVKTINNYKYE
jgi:hypothetical protein